MAATDRYLDLFAKRLLSTAIASASTLVAANSTDQSYQQWRCKPDANNEWQCGQETLAPSGYARPRVLKIPQNPKATTNTIVASQAINPYSQWDWVEKSDLSDKSICKTGCDGAYVAPKADWEDAEKDPEGSPLRADAGSSRLEGDTVLLTEDVLLSQGNRSVKTDKAELNRSTNKLKLSGNIEAREPNLLLRADTANINTDTNLGEFTNARFLIHDNGVRGTASALQRPTQTTLDLVKGTVTQCTPEDEVWLISSGNIHLDTDEGQGDAKHATLKIKDVPVFYVPYISFPIDDRRKTGVLWPTFGSSNDNGFEFTVPYYINIAPNYDATFTPHYIEKRGTMIEAELRHMNRFGEWLVAGSQLNDELYTDNPTPSEEEETPPQENRWIGNLDHSGNIYGVTTRIDYSKVSDEDFFTDLTTDSLELKRTSHLNQQATLGYNFGTWKTQLTVQDHQTVDELLNDQYQLMPRASVERLFTGKSFALDWQLQAEFTDFQHNDSIDEGGSFETGERTFVEAGISYPIRGAAGFIIPTAQIRNISYQLEEFEAGDDDSPSATTPVATLDMGLIFERSTQFGDSPFLQTLEPRLYYFYSELEDQDANPNFDTRELTFSYSQLFRDTRFSGHDRLDDADQLSVGLTSRFIDDEDGREVLTLSLGQIFYFEDREVQINSTDLNEVQSSSNVATEVLYQPSDKVWLTQNLLWDTREDKLDEGGLSLHYQTESNNLFNFGYRYSRLGTSSLSTGPRDLSQVDTSMALALSDRWSLFSRFRYDVEDHRSLDQMVGVQYDDCCWMVRVLYQEGVQQETLDELTNEVNVESDYAFIVEFQLKGLGNLGNKAENLLKESILGYEDLD